MLQKMTKSRKQTRPQRSKGAVGQPERPKLSELLAALPPLADDALPEEIPDSPPERIESF
jgi:hypothetical protein